MLISPLYSNALGPQRLVWGVCDTVNASGGCLKQMSARALNRPADRPQECVCLRKKRPFQQRGEAQAGAGAPRRNPSRLPAADLHQWHQRDYQG